MGKRNLVVISSSEEDEGGGGGGLKSLRRISMSRSHPTTTKSTAKRARRLSDSQSGCHKLELGNFDSLCDDFYDGFRECRKVTGSGMKDKGGQWIEKYRPQSLAELAVHKKKVEEVKTWLKERLICSKGTTSDQPAPKKLGRPRKHPMASPVGEGPKRKRGRPRKEPAEKVPRGVGVYTSESGRQYVNEKLHTHALVVTGQAGVGKSATIHVIASHLGAELCEWNTPTPTLWQEHMHNINSGVQYTSKLEEFENFVERIRKYHLLPVSSNNGGSTKPSILLIDDLPLTNGKSALGRLCTCLQTLVRSTQIPTVILLTEFTSTRDWEDVQSSLEKTGAHKIGFNPITENSIKKTLSKICRAEKCNLSNEQIDQIARVSGGDIRHAITSLQYFCLAPGNGIGSALSFGRDETLSLFHALGKFLHNKRETSVNIHVSDEYEVSDKYTRLPLKMEAPEKVVSQANGQTRAIADFLHENVLEFVSDEAIDDAWRVASYLCDADNLAGSFSSKYEVESSVAQLAASSVAVRGVLFGNSHPAKPKWHAIRSPKLWQVEQLSRRNKNEMIREKNEGLIYWCDVVTMATEYKPALRWLGNLEAQMESCQINDDDDKMAQSDDGIEDDEIEDW